MAAQQDSLTGLKQQVDVLKKKLSDPDAKIDELLLEIETLKDSIHELTLVFQKALAHTKGDDGLNELRKKLDEVVSQNETIAKGMVAISDKLEDFMRKQSASSGAATLGSLPPRPAMPPVGFSAQHTMGMPAPPLGTPARMAPRPAMPPQDFGGMDLPPPPPPPSGDRKKGVGSLFK